jgi:hypothetical protein
VAIAQIHERVSLRCSRTSTDLVTEAPTSSRCAKLRLLLGVCTENLNPDVTVVEAAEERI